MFRTAVQGACAYDLRVSETRVCIILRNSACLKTPLLNLLAQKTEFGVLNYIISRARCDVLFINYECVLASTLFNVLVLIYMKPLLRDFIEY